MKDMLSFLRDVNIMLSTKLSLFEKNCKLFFLEFRVYIFSKMMIVTNTVNSCFASFCFDSKNIHSKALFT